MSVHMLLIHAFADCNGHHAVATALPGTVPVVVIHSAGVRLPSALCSLRPEWRKAFHVCFATTMLMCDVGLNPLASFSF